MLPVCTHIKLPCVLTACTHIKLLCVLTACTHLAPSAPPHRAAYRLLAKIRKRVHALLLLPASGVGGGYGTARCRFKEERRRARMRARPTREGVSGPNARGYGE